ncbi:rRNA processing protein [Rhodosporidiobolus nylandii]
MPKSAKHKSERKADFTKAKLKLGKGKQVAANATNTSFSAKSIALPSQTIQDIPKNAPVSRRNLTLPELLVQTRHYSTQTKREAIVEISQLLAAHPHLLTQHLLPLTTSVAHLIPDSSNSVRQGARDVLRFICENLSQGQLTSVSPGIVLFTLSALSSLDDPVRIDALKILDLLLSFIPEEIVRGWDGTADVSASGVADLLATQMGDEEKGTGAKVVEALLGMLKVRSVGLQKAQGAFTTQAAGSDLSPSARLAVLTTLATFLRASLSPSSVSAPAAASTSTASDPWYLSTSFLTPRAYASFLASFSSSPSTSRTVVCGPGAAVSTSVEPFDLAVDPFTSAAGELALSSFGLFTPPTTPTPAASTSTAPTPKPSLLSLLHPLLLSSFLDSAPTAFSPSASLSLSSSASSRAAAVETVEALLGVARELFHRALGSGSSATGTEGEKERREARKALLALLTHAAPYFPFGSDALPSETSRRSGGEEERFLALNLRFAELSSLLVLSEEDDLAARKALKGKGKKGEREREKKERVEEVVLSRVQEWVVSALSGSLTTPLHPLGLPLAPTAFSALEPTLWSLLNQPDRVRATEVWDATLGMFVRGSGGAETRRRTWEFCARVILLQADPAYSNRFDLSSTLPRSAASDGLPKDAALAKWLGTLPKWLWELGAKDTGTSEALASLLPLLSPFFHLQHPSRGAMPGPFCKLPASAQAKAMDLVVYLSALAPAAAKALQDAVGRAVEVCAKEDEGWARARWTAVAGVL